MAANIGEGLRDGSSFLGSILAGTLLGYLGDRWLGTDPVLVVFGIIAGSVSGFYQMWVMATKADRGRQE